MHEIVIEVLLEVPGAFVLWLITGRKGNFSDYLSKSSSVFNYLMGVLLWAAVILPFAF